MSKKTLLAIAIAASLTPALAANSADTSTDNKAPAVSANSSATTSTSSVGYKSGPTKRGRGVAFGSGHSGHVLNVSHASAEIANLPMDSTSTSITLFGELDAGVKVSKREGGKTKVQLSNGNWYWTSWGIKGIEDLGGGTAAIFTLQQAFKLNNGEGVASAHGDNSGSGGFNNQAFLGLQGPWGRFTFGHQAGLSSGDGDYSMLGGSAIGTGFDMIGDLAGVFITSSWLDNSLAYRTQEWNGLQFTAMYSNGVDGDENKWSKNDHYYGVGLTYDVGNFNSNFMFEHMDHKKPVKWGEGEAKLKGTNLYTVGASYDFGDFTLYGTYQYAQHATRMPGYNYIHIDKKTGASTTVSEPATKGTNQNAASISVAAPLWGGTAMLQLNGVKGKIKNTGEKYNAWSIGSGYTYPLSKRTLVYGSANYGDGKKALEDSTIDGYSVLFGMATSF